MFDVGIMEEPMQDTL